MTNRCIVCQNEIRVQCFRGTGFCSTNCEKKRIKKVPGNREFAIAA